MHNGLFKLGCWLILFFSLHAVVYANVDNNLYLDKTAVVSQQIEFLKNRLVQEKNELTTLQQQNEKRLAKLTPDQVSKQLLMQARLDVTVAKSNLDSMGIELTESQQAISRLEKDAQEFQNELNIYNIFGLKIAANGALNPEKLMSDIKYQKNLLRLEKERSSYLLQLRKIAQDIWQQEINKYQRIHTLLKSQTVLQLKQQQAKSEVSFQQQQSMWLKRLSQFHDQLAKLEQNPNQDRSVYIKLDNDIFYASENVNLTYLQMLIARYQDQLREMKVSLSHSSSITILNKATDQTQVLSKQLARVSDLLTTRITILDKRKSILAQEKLNTADYMARLAELEQQYQLAVTTVAQSAQELTAFRIALDRALQQELSARQGLPGFGAKAWVDLGTELVLVPTLTFQVVKSLVYAFGHALKNAGLGWWMLVLVLEIAWISVFSFLNRYLKRRLAGMTDHEFGHINLKWLTTKVIHRNLLDIAIIGNTFGLFILCGIPVQNFNFLINLGLIWLLFKGFIMVASLCLLETVQDRAGRDVRLYYRLKWSFLIGGVVTAFTVFIHQLPVVYEVKDLFDRLFLLFLLIVSIFLLRSWEVLPGLILPHIDERRTYLKKTVSLLGLLIPLILLVNSAIGLFGFVNFVLTVSWYEGIFLIVLVAYLIIRGAMIDLLEGVSHLLIRHVSNGWLWTEAFLKPIDKVLRVLLFVMAWVVLFLLYGWDQQSPVVERLTKILHYHLFEVLNTSITPQSVLELVVIVALLYWAARWTREFVYRLLLSRTKDMGIRNSIAILSQYSVILVSIFICLRVLGIDFRALAVVASAFAFGIGLGLRDLFNNFACGFLLLIERPLRVGDIVSINDYEGEVIHIGGRAVTIRTWDHMEVLVPNAEIFSKSFVNWTAKDNVIRTVIALKINRHDQPHDVQSLIYQVLANHKEVLTDPAPEVFLKEMSEGLVEFEVRYFINLRQVRSRIGVRSDVLLCIWQAFEKHGIQPPYPHHEVHVTGSVPVIAPRRE